jgi:hypothetical protein
MINRFFGQAVLGMRIIGQQLIFIIRRHAAGVLVSLLTHLEEFLTHSPFP